MKHSTILISLLAIAACGGKKSEPAEPQEPPPEQAAEPVAPPAPPPEPEPPPPRSWNAQAEMAPVKGAKIKGATVTFAQTEGKPVTVTSTGWFEGIKSGKYHLVVHEAAECGPNATKVGKAGGADIEFVATKGMDAIDVEPVETIQLDGDGTIVGRTLVLYDDKKGKPGKALACGSISAAEGAQP